MANDGLLEQISQHQATLGKMEIALGSIADAIVWTDEQGVLQWCNVAFDRLIGRLHIEILGKALVELLPLLQEGKPVLSHEHPVNIALTAQPKAVGLYEFWRNDRKLVLEISSTRAQTSAHGRDVILVVRDITQRKKAEEEIKALNKELESFSYSVSHDLRAPLRSIDGFSKALLEDCFEKLDEQGRDHIQHVRAATQRMGRLIDDLLNLSRLTRCEMHRGKVDLSPLARKICERLGAEHPGRTVEFVIGDGIFANGDEGLLQVVMENLLGNAFKFTSKHPHARIEFGTIMSSGKRVYFVRDDGAGFDERYMDKLFGSFQRLHSLEEFPGTGIGLATTRRIIQRHGGKIWAQGAVEKGATFYFYCDE